MSDLPLSPYTVLDLTIARAGPAAVRLLADWGARVIRVEAPRAGAALTGARRGADEQNLHRNKRSVALNLKDERGHAAFMRLAEQADVIVENFRVDVKRRLRIDYATVRAVNPSVVYGSISGFGQKGPYSGRAGVDQIVQGMSGLMSVTGTAESGPLRTGIAVSDTSAGMFLGQGILLALLQRERTGAGQWVHTSLLEAMLNKLDFQGARYTMLGEVPTPQGNDHPTATPMGAFACADGMVNIAAASDRMWRDFCRAVEAPHLLAVEAYKTSQGRRERKEAIRRDMEAALASMTVAELVERLNAAGVPCGPINTIADGFDNPQAQFLGMKQPARHRALGDLHLIRSPINLSSCPHPQRLRCAAPDPGQDTREVLAEFGFSEAEIDALAAASA